MLNQQQAIDILKNHLILDNRVKALFLKGSLARGEGDEFSDIDFYCLIDEVDFDSFLEDRIFFLERYRPLIYYSEVHFVAPQIVGVYDNGLHIDLYTISKIPIEGTDKIKILYDPHDLIKNYKVIENKIDFIEIANYINEFTFMLLEFETAYMRKDFIWANRLGSHLVSHLSLVLSYIYNKKAPFLGMKRLSYQLPEEIKNKLMGIHQLKSVEDILIGVKELIVLQEMVLKKLEQDIISSVNINFFDFMKLKITSI